MLIILFDNLKNTWIIYLLSTDNIGDYTAALRDEALRLFQKDSDYALPVHWCMNWRHIRYFRICAD